jgi:hypothetical protein
MSSPKSRSAPIGGHSDNSLLKFLSQLQFHAPQGFEGVHNLFDVTECVEVPSVQKNTIAMTSFFMDIATIASRLSLDDAAFRQNNSIPLKSSGLGEGTVVVAVVTHANSLLTD